jgi:hypothetical protein
MASVLRSDVLSLAELHAARLDGELFSVDEYFSPVDEVETLWLRAEALRLAAGTRMIAELATAAWLHGARAMPPTLHTMCVPRSDRMKVPPAPRYVVREVTHTTADIATVRGLRVTVPARTLFDLALTRTRGADDDARGILERWPGLAAECTERITLARNLPGKVAALRRLESWAAR